MTVLMVSHLAMAATSQWNGTSGLSGNNQSIPDAFEVPGNATVIDAWLHVDESGYLEDGYGETWTGEDVPGNFTAGQFTNTMVGKFEGAMSLTPDTAVSNINSFSSASLQLPSSWSSTGGIWGVVNPSGMGGTLSGQTRTLAHGYVPAAAADGGVVAATLPGQPLPQNSSGALVAPSFSIPSPISNFNLTFSQWHHLDAEDGAWVEVKLDNGPWTYIEPNGVILPRSLPMQALPMEQTVVASEFTEMVITVVGIQQFSTWTIFQEFLMQRLCSLDFKYGPIATIHSVLDGF